MQTEYLMPPNSAKRLSPLDNSLFHQWKETVQKLGRITKNNIVQIMTDERNHIKQSTLMAHYRHCRLIHNNNPYFDCPDPSSHQRHLH